MFEDCPALLGVNKNGQVYLLCSISCQTSRGGAPAFFPPIGLVLPLYIDED